MLPSAAPAITNQSRGSTGPSLQGAFACPMKSTQGNSRGAACLVQACSMQAHKHARNAHHAEVAMTRKRTMHASRAPHKPRLRPLHSERAQSADVAPTAKQTPSQRTSAAHAAHTYVHAGPAALPARRLVRTCHAARQPCAAAHTSAVPLQPPSAAARMPARDPVHKLAGCGAAAGIARAGQVKATACSPPRRRCRCAGGPADRRC